MPTALENETSGLQKDSVSIHPPHRQETDANNRQRIEQRRKSRRPQACKGLLEYAFLPAERSTQYLRNYVGGNRVAAQNNKRFRPPAAILLDVNRPITHRQTNHGEASGEEHIRTRP